MPDESQPGPAALTKRRLAKPLLLLAGLLPAEIRANGVSTNRSDAVKAETDIVPRYLASCCEAFEVLPDKVRLSGQLSNVRKTYLNMTRFISNLVDSPKFRGSRRLRRGLGPQCDAREGDLMEVRLPQQPLFRGANATPSLSPAFEEAMRPTTAAGIVDQFGSFTSWQWPFRWGVGGSVIAELFATGGTAVRVTFQALYCQLSKCISEDVTLTAVVLAGTVGAIGASSSLPTEAARQLLSSSRGSAGNIGIQASLSAGAVTGDLFPGPLALRSRTRTATEQSEASDEPSMNWLPWALGACGILLVGSCLYCSLARFPFSGLQQALYRTIKGVSQQAASR